MKKPIEYIDIFIAIYQERLNSWLLAPENDKSYEHIATLKGILLGLKMAKDTF